jgi:hypothetical protein
MPMTCPISSGPILQKEFAQLDYAFEALIHFAGAGRVTQCLKSGKWGQKNKNGSSLFSVE